MAQYGSQSSQKFRNNIPDQIIINTVNFHTWSAQLFESSQSSISIITAYGYGLHLGQTITNNKQYDG